MNLNLQYYRIKLAKRGDFSGTVFLVQEKNNPSTDYYVLPKLNHRSRSILLFNHHAALPDLKNYNTEKLAVVFVRYIPYAWLFWIVRYREYLSELAFFMDDDLFDLSAALAMPWRYRLKLARLSTLHQFWLKKIGAELWVSTNYLLEKYADWQPLLVSPQPLPVNQLQPIILFYHGSASHHVEIQWLIPIIREVLYTLPTIFFEIIGAANVNHWYRNLPRVSVIHPMNWENYLSFCQSRTRHIGLAPLLSNKFNDARSYIKFFDIQRCGAAGIYSAVSPFNEFIQNGKDGVLLENNPQIWIETILRLANNTTERESIIIAAQQRIKHINSDGHF